MAVPLIERDGTLLPGAPNRLFDIETQGLAANQPHNIAVAAHGQKFLINAVVGGSNSAPIEVTLNWTSHLQR